MTQRAAHEASFGELNRESGRHIMHVGQRTGEESEAVAIVSRSQPLIHLRPISKHSTGLSYLDARARLGTATLVPRTGNDLISPPRQISDRETHGVDVHRLEQL